MNRVPRIIVLFGNIPLLGQERANIDAMEALKRSGCDVLFFVRREPWAEPLRQHLTAKNLNWVIAPFTPHRTGRGMSLTEILRNTLAMVIGSTMLLWYVYRWRPTHIHVANPIWILSFFPALLFTRIPLIYNIGDIPNVSHFGWRALWKFIFFRTCQFVAVSQFVTKRIVALGVPERKITLIYGRAPTRVTTTPFIRQSKRFRFVFIGQITKNKGVDVLLEACEIVGHDREFEVLIAGDLAETPFIREVRNKVDECLFGSVRLVGFVENIGALLAVSDVHVCPSVWDEPLGLVVMEAKEAARPSIVFASGGIPEMIRHELDGFICANKTARSLADAMRWYLDRPKAAVEHGIRAKNSLRGFWKAGYEAQWRAIYDQTTGAQ